MNTEEMLKGYAQFEGAEWWPRSVEYVCVADNIDHNETRLLAIRGAAWLHVISNGVSVGGPVSYTGQGIGPSERFCCSPRDGNSSFHPTVDEAIITALQLLQVTSRFKK